MDWNSRLTLTIPQVLAVADTCLLYTSLRLARKGLVTESEYNDLQLWYFNGHTMSCWFGPLGVDGTGSLYGLTFDYQTASPTKTQFYLLDDYYRVMNHLTE